MFRRFFCICLTTFALGLGYFSTDSFHMPLEAQQLPLEAQQPVPDKPLAVQAQPLADQQALAKKGIELLDRGPVH